MIERGGILKYQISLDIHDNLKRVTTLYINQKRMKEWEKGLSHIEQTKGTLFQTGSEGFLVFSFNDIELKMKVYVESNQLPREITLIYEVSGVWNRCVNSFKETNGVTRWNMDVEFRFSQANDTPVERFIEKTKEGMNTFKRFVEDNRA